ncbi:MAG: hypothetical protein MJE63_04605 [Proteobacteria bacterium]|nr:hypothetical protein [Pseudomonadota bacterium]
MIQREIEKAGISTISITFSKEITSRIKPPRSIFTGFPLGHPFSFPKQRFRQISILRLALKYLDDITVPGTIVDLDLTENDDPAVSCVVCSG